MAFIHLHDRYEGDWQGFEPRFYQDLVDPAASFTQSGYSELEYTKSYILRWSDWQVTESGFGGIRVNFYDNTYTSITGGEYIDIPFKLEQSDSWRKNIVRLKPFKDEIGLSDYVIPSGTRYAKIQILIPNVTGVTTERYVNQLDLVEGNSYVGYTSFSGDTTFVSYKGLNNGYYPGNPLMRETYEFVGQRLWKSEDAATKSDEFLTYEDTKAVNNTEYTYVIDAFDLNGNKSPLSDQKIIMAGDIYPPAQVTGLVGVPGPEALVLVWTAPTDTDYSHVNIYSDAGFNTLVKPEFGSPGSKDTTIIGGLTPGIEKVYYLCSVDVYGNENRISAPTVTGTPTAFSNTEDLLITLDGDDYVKQETETFLVWSRLPLVSVPTVTGYDSSNNIITVSTITEIGLTSTLFSGNFTVSAGNSEGQARLLASGVTTESDIALSPFKTFVIDKTAPTVGLTLLEPNYDSGTKKFYNKNSMGKFSVTLTDVGGAGSYIYRLNSSSNSEPLPYIDGTVNGTSLLLPSEGLNTIYVKGRDIAGNESGEASLAVYRDSESPIVSISGVGSSSQYGLWSNSTTTLSVKFLAKDNEVVGASDVSGFYRLYYRYAYNRAPNTGDTWYYSASADPTITIPPTGAIPAGTASIQIEYYGQDNAGNMSEHVVETLNIDNVAPTFTAGLWGNCQPVPGGFHLVWDPSKITDASPSSGLKQIRIYRDTTSAMTTKSGVAVIGFNSTATRSFVDSSQMENYKWYWWAMEAEDNAGNISTLSTTVSGQIGHNITGIFRNLISNGSFERIENYETNTPASWWKFGSPLIDKTSTPYHGTNYALVDPNNYYYIQNFPLINAKTNQRRVFSCYAKKISSSTSILAAITFKFYNATKQLIQTSTKTYPLINGTWSGIAIPIGNSAGSTGFDLPSSAGSVTALSCDIFISGIVGTVGFDAIQLELPALNTTVTGTAYVDSYNISGDVIQGQRIIGSQIEADTITAEHLTIGVHGGNALYNSSFEMTNYNNTQVAGWTLTGGAETTTESSFEGYRAIKFVLAGTPTISSDKYIKIDRNTQYCLSFNSRNYTASTSNMALYLYQYDISGALISSAGVPVTVSGNFALNNIPWNSYASKPYLTVGYGTSNPFHASCESVKLGMKKISGEITHVDAIQFEEGSLPTLWADGGFTEIDGGVIKTGKIQGTTNDKTYFDLDTGILRTFETGMYGLSRFTELNAGGLHTIDTNGDWTDIIAGRISTLNAATNRRTDIIAGEVINADNVTGNYSRLTDGVLEFYNASAALLTNYGNQIIYLAPWELNCGTAYTFQNAYVNQPPIVVMIPNMFKCYAAVNSASDQFIGFDAQPVTKTGFMPRAFLYAGLPTNITIPGTAGTISDPSMTFASDSATIYSASDARDIGHGGSVNSVYVTLRTSNTNATSKIVTNTMTIRIASGIGSPYTWPTDVSKIEATQVVALNTFKNDSEWNYTTIQFNNLGLNNKIVKVDWHGQSAADACSCELYQVQYINTPTTSGLTGYNVAGALIIGRTI